MIRLEKQGVFDEYHRLEPIEDLIRIQKALFVLRNIYCTLDECGNIWQNYSGDLCASWLCIPIDFDSIVKHIESADGFKSYEDWIE